MGLECSSKIWCYLLRGSDWSWMTWRTRAFQRIIGRRDVNIASIVTGRHDVPIFVSLVVMPVLLFLGRRSPGWAWYVVGPTGGMSVRRAVTFSSLNWRWSMPFWHATLVRMRVAVRRTAFVGSFILRAKTAVFSVWSVASYHPLHTGWFLVGPPTQNELLLGFWNCDVVWNFILANVLVSIIRDPVASRWAACLGRRWLLVRGAVTIFMWSLCFGLWVLVLDVGVWRVTRHVWHVLPPRDRKLFLRDAPLLLRRIQVLIRVMVMLLSMRWRCCCFLRCVTTVQRWLPLVVVHQSLAVGIRVGRPAAGILVLRAVTRWLPTHVLRLVGRVLLLFLLHQRLGIVCLLIPPAALLSSRGGSRPLLPSRPGLHPRRGGIITVRGDVARVVLTVAIAPGVGRDVTRIPRRGSRRGSRGPPRLVESTWVNMTLAPRLFGVLDL